MASLAARSAFGVSVLLFAIAATLACENLSGHYEIGLGVPADLARANALLEKSCGLGGSAACNRLGLRYTDGNYGLPKDAERASHFFAVGRSARSGRCPSLVWIASRSAARHAVRSCRFGSMDRRSRETSLPSSSPNPPGSRKSRCMSMMTRAQRAGSNPNS